MGQLGPRSTQDRHATRRAKEAQEPHRRALLRGAAARGTCCCTLMLASELPALSCAITVPLKPDFSGIGEEVGSVKDFETCTAPAVIGHAGIAKLTCFRTTGRVNEQSTPHSWHVNLNGRSSSTVKSAVKVSPDSMALVRVPLAAAV